MNDAAPLQPDHHLIQQVPFLSGLSDDEADQLWAGSVRRRVATGELLIREGDPGEALFIILSGEFEVAKREGDREIVLARRYPGEFIGEMALLERAPRTATVRATQGGQLLEIDASTFQRLLDTRPGLATSLLRTVAMRLRSTEALLVQSDKLASLGTLAAGLAHELNNPAAAIQRSSSLLREAFETWRVHAAAVATLPMDAHERQVVAAFESRVAGSDRPPRLSAVTRQAETQIMDWLERRSVPEPWEVAPVLAAYGWRIEDFAALSASPHLAAIVGWVAARLTIGQMLDEIEVSSAAIAAIVAAVKSYAYLDQAPVQDVDVRRSIEDTLLILKHKLKQGIEVTRTFDTDVPRVEAYAGELNQVWTNIIDNAAQAMGGSGTLELTLRALGDEVEVRIADSGPGIPAAIAGKIFEPFFTTKAQGVGTGLGLHIAHNIIVNRHHGRIEFTSHPGRTEFRIVLPVRLDRRAA